MLDALVVPFVFIVYVTVPSALLTNVLKSVTLNVFTVSSVWLTSILFESFPASISFVAVACFTVVVLAIVAVIVDFPDDATAFNVVPFTIITFVFDDVYVTLPCVPPSPVTSTFAVAVPFNLMLSGTLSANLIVLVYFSTVIVNSLLALA